MPRRLSYGAVISSIPTDAYVTAREIYARLNATGSKTMLSIRAALSQHAKRGRVARIPSQCAESKRPCWLYRRVQ